MPIGGRLFRLDKHLNNGRKTDINWGVNGVKKAQAGRYPAGKGGLQVLGRMLTM